MRKLPDIYSLLGIILALGIAIFTPSIPKISGTINIINGLIIFFITALLIIILNLYLAERNKKKILQSKTDKLESKLEEIKKEIAFLKERFKTLEDFSELKGKVKIIERYIKNE